MAIRHFVITQCLTKPTFKMNSRIFSLQGDWREKRLLGYSLETSAKSDVKLVSCVVSILLSINNDQVERLLAKMEESMSENFERKIDEFRDDVDIKMDGMSQIVSTTQDYVATKRRGSVDMLEMCSVVMACNGSYTEAVDICTG